MQQSHTIYINKVGLSALSNMVVIQIMLLHIVHIHTVCRLLPYVPCDQVQEVRVQTRPFWS